VGYKEGVVDKGGDNLTKLWISGATLPKANLGDFYPHHPAIYYQKFLFRVNLWIEISG